MSETIGPWEENLASDEAHREWRSGWCAAVVGGRGWLVWGPEWGSPALARGTAEGIVSAKAAADAALRAAGFLEDAPAPAPPAAAPAPDLVKHDTGKAPWHLLPWDEVAAVVSVLGFGAAKYSPGGWKTGGEDAPGRYFAAVMRHLVAARTEFLDAESGLPHLAHAACGCIFLLWYARHRPAFVAGGAT